MDVIVIDRMKFRVIDHRSLSHCQQYIVTLNSNGTWECECGGSGNQSSCPHIYAAYRHTQRVNARLTELKNELDQHVKQHAMEQEELKRIEAAIKPDATSQDAFQKPKRRIKFVD